VGGELPAYVLPVSLPGFFIRSTPCQSEPEMVQLCEFPIFAHGPLMHNRREGDENPENHLGLFSGCPQWNSFARLKQPSRVALATRCQCCAATRGSKPFIGRRTDVKSCLGENHLVFGHRPRVSTRLRQPSHFCRCRRVYLQEKIPMLAARG
jgi:hypothetical protein